MNLKLLFLFALLSIPLTCIFSQEDKSTIQTKSGIYIGAESYVASIDKWKFERNDLNIEKSESSNNGNGLALSPYIGYRFGNVLRAEISYRKKDFIHGIRLMNGDEIQRTTYDAKIITVKFKYDQYLIKDKLILSPSFGIAAGSLGDNLSTQSTVDIYTRRPIFHRDGFVGLELGLELQAKLFKELKFSTQFYLVQGMTDVVTVRHDLSDNTTFNHSRLISNGSTLGLAFGLKYHL